MTRGVTWLIGLMVTLSGAHVAAQSTSTATELSAPLWMSDYSVSRPMGAAGWLRSPATAWSGEGLSLAAVGSLSSRPAALGEGLGLATGLRWRGVVAGFGVERWARALPGQPTAGWFSSSRLTAGLGVELDGWIRLAAVWRRLQLLPAPLDRIDSVDVAVQAQLWSWLTVALHVNDFFGDTLYRFAPDLGVSAGPVYRAGVSVHPPTNQWRASVDLSWFNGRRVQSVEGIFAWRDRLGVHGRWTVDGAMETRIALFARWPIGSARLFGSIWGDAGSPSGLGGDVRLSVSSPSWRELGRRWRARSRSARGDTAALLALAQRQRRGWELPLDGDAAKDAAAVAKAVWQLNAVLAASNGAELCKKLGSKVTLDVEVGDPKLVYRGRASRRAVCRQLSQKSGPWWRYLYEVGPAFIHAEIPSLLGALFAIHGSAYEWIPAEQERAYRASVRRRGLPKRCHSWRVLPVSGYVGERREVEVVILCDDLRDYVIGLSGDSERGFRLSRLLVRLQNATP